jgi:hypothetical protein
VPGLRARVRGMGGAQGALRRVGDDTGKDSFRPRPGRLSRLRLPQGRREKLAPGRQGILAHNRCMERGKGFFGRRLSEAERRKILVRTYYDFEVECRRQGWGDPAFVYDEEKDLFR